MRIIVGGDIAPTETNEQLFQEGEIEQLIGNELLQLIGQADLRIYNLEVPLISSGTPISKSGPTLFASSDTINGIMGFRPDVMTLANNHCMDYGRTGLFSTIQLLQDNNIAIVGVGENSVQARKPVIIQILGWKIGIYGCAEKEFSIATQTFCGANHFDALVSLDDIEALSEECDYSIVLFHGGKVGYQYPSPDLQRVCRRMIEKGADLVVLQHSHCIGCYERFGDGMIVYGQGNLLFDYGKDMNSLWNTGLLLAIDLEAEKKEIEFIPVERKENMVRLAGKNKESILEEYQQRSFNIMKPQFIVDEYQKFAEQKLFGLYSNMLGGIANNFFFKILSILFGKRIWRYILNRKAMLVIWNYINCESIRELISVGIMTRIANEKSSNYLEDTNWQNSIRRKK